MTMWSKFFAMTSRLNKSKQTWISLPTLRVSFIKILIHLLFKSDFYALQDLEETELYIDNVICQNKTENCTINYTSKKPSFKSFIQRVAAKESANAIVYSPLAKPMQNNITKDEFLQMWTCIDKLVELGIVHRDITPHHFMKSKFGVVLIDFGSAFFARKCDLDRSDNPEEVFEFRGSLEFAALEVFEKLCKEPFK